MDDATMLEIVQDTVRAGRSHAAAEARARQLADEPAQAERVMAEFLAKLRVVKILKDPKVAALDGLPEAWYTGSDDDSVFWPLAVASMRDRELPDDAVDAVDRATTKTLSLCDPPGGDRVRTRGLVLGYVQSGKTTNFVGLMAKAADAGYRFIIVLTGLTENLRRQTQERVEAALVEPKPAQWFLTTTADEDFTVRHNAGNVLGNTAHRVLAVVKKNPHRLKRLNDWLTAAGNSVLQNCPILLIDDEADQASINVASDPGLRSRINTEIGDILDRPKAAYVAYTATPFANVLIDPKDDSGLYPRNFIVDLPRPGHGYLGAVEVFGRSELDDDDESVDTDGYDMVREVPEADAARVIPPRAKEDRDFWSPEVPASLDSALRWFLLATAARRTRDGKKRHSSMLVHVSQLTDAQLAFKPVLTRWLGEFTKAVADGDDVLLNELGEQWTEESSRVGSGTFGLSSVSFGALFPELHRVCAQATVIVDNYVSPDRLSYDDDEPQTVIVVGGNTLSRGLTLEGLVSSYFVRTARAFDTLLQMGRWFGYRVGWQDLPRIWTTAELAEWFQWLARVEEEIRRDIARYDAEHMTPREFAIRIAQHPDFAVTAALKMRDAVPAHVSYSKTRKQTILFNHRDRDWLETNLDAARTLIEGVSGSHREVRTSKGTPLFTDVPVRHVISFLSRYRIHENAFDFRNEMVEAYIRKQNDHGLLHSWNIAVAGRSTAPRGSRGGPGTLDLGLSEDVLSISRARLALEGIKHANIKSLMSKVDLLLDAPDVRASGMSYEDMWDVRRSKFPDTGLLVLYPIDRDSPPKGGNTKRRPLDAVIDVVGLAIVFPETADRLDVDYVAAALDPGAIEEPEDLDAILENDLDLRGGDN